MAALKQVDFVNLGAHLFFYSQNYIDHGVDLGEESCYIKVTFA